MSRHRHHRWIVEKRELFGSWERSLWGAAFRSRRDAEHHIKTQPLIVNAQQLLFVMYRVRKVKP